MNKLDIRGDEITRHDSYDRNGYVFFWGDKVFRAVYRKNQDAMQKLWDSGLIQKLMASGLFPKTELTDYRLGDCELVFQHEKIDVISFPNEWSFNMLKDAALAILRVNQVAREYGYQTVDSHGFNIAFRHGTPCYIDLGSFIEIANDFKCERPGWRPYGEFLRFFYAPLKLWSGGERFFASQSLYGLQMPMTSLWRYRYSLLRLLPVGYLALAEMFFLKYKGVNTVPVGELFQLASGNATRERLARSLVAFSKKWGLPFSSVDLHALERKIERIKPPPKPFSWSARRDRQSPVERDKFIIEKVAQIGAESVLEIAASPGAISRAILENRAVRFVICAYDDESVIDKLYLGVKGSNLNLFPVIMDFSLSVGDTSFSPVESRLKADLVLELAPVLDLVLTKKLTLDFIMNRLKRFARKYVAVEFMPLGDRSSPSGKGLLIPDWYTIDWFRNGFERAFDLIEEREIGLDRVIFLGRARE